MSFKHQLGKTPLLAACEIGNAKIAKLLIDAGADVPKADKVSEYLSLLCFLPIMHLTFFRTERLRCFMLV